jgi:hypothetical protein
MKSVGKQPAPPQGERTAAKVTVRFWLPAGFTTIWQ